MSRNIPLTSSFRQPVRSLFLILLVGVISFAFVSKAVEYIVVQRETGRLGGYYRSIGSLERLDGNDAGDVSQGANLIIKSQYLAYEDRRRVSSGVLQDIWNADVDHIMSDNSSTPAGLLTGVHNSDMWFYGTLSERDLRSAGFGWYSLTFQVDKVLAGYPEDLAAGSELNLHFILAGHEDSIPKIESMQVGQRYLIRGWFDHGTSYSEIQIRPLDDADLWYLPVEAGSDVDLNAPSLAGIKNEIDILNQNQHALFLVGTTDMSALPDMQESSHLFFLVDGRWLNHQDDLDGRRVIVIQREFANVRGLKLGDTISMTLRGLRNPFWGYITGDDRENWRTYPTQQETFEIVGIYDDLVGLNLSIYSTEAYVPNSVLSADVVVPGDILNPQSFSFVLDSSQHQEAFVNQYKEPLAQLGFGLTFVENNGAAFWTGVLPLRRSALAGLLVYGLVLLLALALAVFLYLNQRRKDYAILRALGVSKDQANHQVLLPILLIGAAGIIGGGIPSWKYALEKSAETISTLPTPAGALPSATLSPIYLGLIGMGLLLLLFCFAWAGARILAGKPILDLLGRAVPVRGRQRQVKPVQRTTSSIQPGTLAVSAAMPEEHPLDVMPRVPFSAENQIQRVIKTGPKRGIAEIRALARFGFRQIGRDGLRSLLTTLVALGLVLALGWIQWNMDKNRAEVDHLYGTTVVEAEIVKANSSLVTNAGGFIAQGTVDQILASGFIRSAYTEAAAQVLQVMPVADPETPQDVGYYILAFDQPENFFATLSTRDTVQYAAGVDESLFTQNWDVNSLRRNGVPAVFPETILDQFGLKIGDQVYLSEESGTTYPYHVVGQYTPGVRQYSASIVGSIGDPILLPLSVLKAIQGDKLYYSTVKFIIDPAKNRDLPAFEAQTTKLVSNQDAGRLPLKIHFWDEELRSVVEPLEKNFSLLEVLYPVTVAVSALIGAGLCLLLILQQARDTALLRTLGVGKTSVRAVLCSEQILLSLAGVLLGLGLLGGLRQNLPAVLGRPAFLAAGSYLLGALIGSLIGAISISNKKPLDLLQVKE